VDGEGELHVRFARPPSRDLSQILRDRAELRGQSRSKQPQGPVAQRL